MTLLISNYPLLRFIRKVIVKGVGGICLLIMIGSVVMWMTGHSSNRNENTIVGIATFIGGVITVVGGWPKKSVPDGDAVDKIETEQNE
jgi:Na+/melibiose symporter-like transporter